MIRFHRFNRQFVHSTGSIYTSRCTYYGGSSTLRRCLQLASRHLFCEMLTGMVQVSRSQRVPNVVRFAFHPVPRAGHRVAISWPLRHDIALCSCCCRFFHLFVKVFLKVRGVCGPWPTDCKGLGLLADQTGCCSQIGQTGIVVQLRQNTVQIITPADQLLVVAKRQSTFHVRLNDMQSVVLRGECMGRA